MATTGKYRKYDPLSMEEIESLPAIIGTPQLCGIGGVSIVTAQRLMKSGTFSTATKLGHGWRVSKREVMRYFGLSEA